MNLVCTTNWQRTDSATTACFTKPVTKPQARNKNFRAHSYKFVAFSSDFCLKICLICFLPKQSKIFFYRLIYYQFRRNWNSGKASSKFGTTSLCDLRKLAGFDHGHHEHPARETVIHTLQLMKLDCSGVLLMCVHKPPVDATLWHAMFQMSHTVDQVTFYCLPYPAPYPACH